MKTSAPTDSAAIWTLFFFSLFSPGTSIAPALNPRQSAGASSST